MSSTPDVLGDARGTALITEEARSYLQSRVQLYVRVAFVLVAVHYAFINGLRTVGGHPWSDWLNEVALTHLTTAIVLLSTWMVLRSAKLSAAVLHWIDAFTTLCFVGGIAGLGIAARQGYAPEMVVVVGGTLALFARATLVPSAAGYTAAISSAGAIIMVSASYYIAADTAAIRPDIKLERGTWYYATIVLSWCALMVAMSTIASHIIYGLRQKVRQAQVLGQYQLEEKIGEGAMGVVYRARHAFLPRPTAVKLLRPEMASRRFVERFKREVSAVARLQHPSTIAIYDTGRTPDGALYYAMELLDGIELRDIVMRHGALPPGRVIHLLRQACGSLAEAHEARMIHRDVKPGNIMVCRHGGMYDVVKLLDFGLVKEHESNRVREGPQLTTERSVIGTPAYMSPEAITDPLRVDARTDLYALGAVGYFMLTGSNMFNAQTRDEVLRLQLTEIPPFPSDRLGRPIPEDLERIIMRCLEKDRDARPASARELDEALGKCQDASSWTQHEARTWWRGPQMESPARAQREQRQQCTESATGRALVNRTWHGDAQRPRRSAAWRPRSTLRDAAPRRRISHVP